MERKRTNRENVLFKQTSVTGPGVNVERQSLGTFSHPDVEMGIDPRAVGRRLTELRELSGKSLSAVADAAGIAKSYLLKLERGEVENPGLATLASVAKALDVTLASLLGPASTPATRSARAREDARAQDAQSMPEGLKEFLATLEKRGEHVPADVKRSLALIQFRGRRPQAPEDWQFIYEAVKRSVRRS